MVDNLMNVLSDLPLKDWVVLEQLRRTFAALFENLKVDTGDEGTAGHDERKTICPGTGRTVVGAGTAGGKQPILCVLNGSSPLEEKFRLDPYASHGRGRLMPGGMPDAGRTCVPV